MNRFARHILIDAGIDHVVSAGLAPFSRPMVEAHESRLSFL